MPTVVVVVVVVVAAAAAAAAAQKNLRIGQEMDGRVNTEAGKVGARASAWVRARAGVRARARALVFVFAGKRARGGVCARVQDLRSEPLSRNGMSHWYFDITFCDNFMIVI